MKMPDHTPLALGIALGLSMDRAAAETSRALREGRVGEYDEPKRKPKRIRPPRQTLGIDDISAGGEYVPKRGNNRTPNIVVERTTLDHESRVRKVRYRQRDEVHVCTDAEFLKLVARRVEN